MLSLLPALLLSGLLSQPAEVPPFVKNNVQKVTYYYKAPDASLGPKLLAELLEKETIEHPWFAKNEHVLVLIGAQLGDMAQGKPEIVRQYEAAFADAPSKGRGVILRALWNCGDDETLKVLGVWLSDQPSQELRRDLEGLTGHLADPDRKHVRDTPAAQPQDIDFLWSNFFITGEYAPVSRVLDVFDLPPAREHDVLKRVARWSLGSNVQQHPKLVELVMKHAPDRPPGSKKVIDETILRFPAEKK